MKTKNLTNKKCLRCGSFVYKETNKKIDYPYYCKTCYENMYNFEVEEVEDKNEI